MPLPPPQPIVAGTGGISAQQEYERRRAKHDRKIEDKWGSGIIGGLAKRLSAEPQSTRAWAKGADGEQRLATFLDTRTSDEVIVLHDRKVAGTRGNIDHIVIAPSGIWVIDAKNYTGKVEQRNKAGVQRLYVNNRDQTRLAEKMRWQVDAIAKHLAPMGFAALPIQPVICFTNAEWALLTKPIVIDDVVITWGRALVEAINEPGGLLPDAARAIAVELSSRLPASA